MRWHHCSLRELLLHGVIIAVPCVLLIILALYQLAPSGTFTVSAGSRSPSPYVNRILPQERAPDSTEADSVSIIDEPVYFSVNVPDGYTSVDVMMEYQNHGQPIIELGALTDIFAQSYDLQPIENTLIDALDWKTVATGDGGRLLQREDNMTAAAFAAQPPARYRVATYHDEIVTPYRESTYTPLGTTQTITASLRGYHKFATYIKNEQLAFTIGYMDMNRTEGADDGLLRVWNEDGDVVREQHISDDGITSDGQNSSPLAYLTITASDLPEGVYSVELSGTSDIFWRTITTPQRYVTFLNRVYIGDDVGYRDGDYRTSFVTNAKHVALETFHADSSEEVVFGAVSVQLPVSQEKVRYTIADRGLVSGYTNKGDVKMTGDGLFALTAASFFNPYPVQMNVYTDLDALNVDYVLTSYQSPVTNADGWSAATATFALADMYQKDGAATFVISVPSIADRAASVDVRRITLRYHKTPPTLRDMARQLRDWFIR